MPIPEERREDIHKRLNYIQGTINGIHKMVDEQRQCVDILTQLSSVYEGTRKVSSLMMRNYLENCVTRDLRSEDPETVERMYDEIMKVFHKYSK
ncbi:MAG TPA: metal-sensitive transcriptional regulator [Pseudogracilibacillus sp.]|nr:metal-sensitive transcriptional regulator [Pseudogracilibacillus sp.]